MKTFLSHITLTRFAVLSVLLSAASPVVANDATWLASPASGDWHNDANWTAPHPDWPTDTATFDVSSITNVSLTDHTRVEDIVFNAGASAYTLSLSGTGRNIYIHGVGIVNNSGITQQFVTASNGSMTFYNSATAGTLTTYTMHGSVVPDAGSGVVSFQNNSTAGSASFTTHGGVGTNTYGGFTLFFDNSSAANGHFVTHGGNGTDSVGGELAFSGSSTAANATLIANGGTNGAYLGGAILFRHSSTGGTSRVQVNGNGFVDIGFRTSEGVTIGSLEGSGDVYLGEYKLTVGSNNLSTTFSGIIQDGRPGGSGNSGGSFGKIGSGTLTLSGNSTYTGATSVDAGTLLVNGSVTSAVTVNSGGTLGGNGIVGAVTVNSGGTVAPGNSAGKLTVDGAYSQASGGTLAIEIGGPAAGSGYDQLVVNGPATLGGTLNLTLINGYQPQDGDVFTVISPGSISGTFATVNTNGFTGSTEYTSTGVKITVNNVAPVITSPTTASGTQDAAFSYQITATNNPTSYGASGLPAGLTVNTATGLISGTPSESGTFNVTISAANSAGNGVAQLSLTVAATPSPSPTASAMPSPSPTASATPTPTATVSATPTPSASPSPSPAATPSNKLLNIATRLRVGTGENALIGGFIITGTEPKKVIIRAIGPSLADQDVAGALQDPTLELFDGAGEPITSNDDWKETQQAEIEETTIPPRNDAESAIVRTLEPGNYTAVVRGKSDGTGIGLVEVYDLASAVPAKLANISSRGFVETGENALIGGFIAGGSEGGNPARVVVRALGPSLADQGVNGALLDPTLELIDANGSTVRENDNWKADQQIELEALGLQPTHEAEAALIDTLPSGNYTALVRGSGDTTGVGLVEVYNVP